MAWEGKLGIGLLLLHHLRTQWEFMVQEPTIQQWLSVIGLESKEVISLFAVLDDGNGEVPSDALVKGSSGLQYQYLSFCVYMCREK